MFRSYLAEAAAARYLNSVEILSMSDDGQWFDAKVAGGHFRLACFVDNESEELGVLRCYDVSQFAQHPGAEVRSVRVTIWGDVRDDRIRGSLSSPAGCASVFASLVLPGLVSSAGASAEG